LFVAAWGAVSRPAALAAGTTALDLPLGALLIALGLSAAVAPDPMTNLRGRYDSYAYGLWGMALVSAAASFSSRCARGREVAPARWLSWSAAVVGGYAVLQKLGFDPVFQFKALPTGGRAVSSLGSPVDLGAMMALLWPAALWRADAERRIFPMILAVLVAGGLIASGSRGAMLAAGVGTAAYWLLTRREPGVALRRCILLAVAVAALAVAWSYRSGGSVRDLARREVWKTALHASTLRPWLGWGPDGFEDAFKLLRTDAFVALLGSNSYQAYAHNDILHVLSAAGLLGLAAYAWLLIALAWAARRSLDSTKNRALAAALTAGLLALWVNLKLNPVALEVLALAAVCAGLLASLPLSAPPKAPSRWPLLGLAALASCSFVYAAQLARIDAVFKRGAKAQAVRDFPSARSAFARARRGVPCELSYITAEINAIGDWINATRDVKERLSLLALVDADAREAIACHPRQAVAHYIAGAAARMHADLGFKGRLEDAAREFDLALALDPKLVPLQDARREVTRLMSPASSR